MILDGDLVLRLHGAEVQELPGKVAVVTLRTSRGDIQAYLHPSETGRSAVVWAGGANGDVNGPAAGLFSDLSTELVAQGISSLRVRYRSPGRFYECVLDILAGVSFLRGLGAEGVALVGHGLGGAASIMAGVLNERIDAVAALSSQSFGTHLVRQLSPRPLLVAHGGLDEVCSPTNAESIYFEAREPKDILRFPLAGHMLMESRDELRDHLAGWLVGHLGGEKIGHAARATSMVRPLVCDDGDNLRVKQIVLFQGDITTIEADAIVCPNNDELWLGAGVTGAILRRGGESLMREAIAHAPAQVGDCVVTGAGSLRAKWVFHAVVSGLTRHGVPTTQAAIAKATESCFREAAARGITTMAWPALGTGGGGLPFEVSAQVLIPAAVKALRATPSLDKVVFVLYGPGAFSTFASRLEAET